MIGPNPFEILEERLIRIERMLEAMTKIPSNPVPVLRDECGIDEAAEVTGLRRSTIYRLSSKGEVPCKRRGRMLLFSRKELIAWNNDRTIEKRNPEEVAAENLALRRKR
jgi:excisionase family DNA binding protein